VDVWSLVDGRWCHGDTERASLRWFDLEAGHGDLEELAGRYHLHPLAVEDCRSPLLHAPKIDEFGDYLFVVLQAVLGEGVQPRLEELDAFVGPDFLITYRDGPIPEIAEVHEALARGMTMRPGADGLLYEVVDRVVDATLPRVDAISEELDSVQASALSDPTSAEQARVILEMRAAAGHLRRTLAPQLSVIQRLSRGEFAEIADANRIYFRDIYDHLVRVDLALEGVREDADVALSIYLSALNNRLSEVMKVLSVVAALALPATVISGVFGTNFDNVPGLHSNWGFALMIATMTGVAVGMALYFRRRGWF
jgi:magnesium transporter